MLKDIPWIKWLTIPCHQQQCLRDIPQIKWLTIPCHQQQCYHKSTYLLAASWMWDEACSTSRDENCSSRMRTASEVPKGLSGSMMRLMKWLMTLSSLSCSGAGGPPTRRSPSPRSKDAWKQGIKTYCRIWNHWNSNMKTGDQNTAESETIETVTWKQGIKTYCRIWHHWNSNMKTGDQNTAESETIETVTWKQGIKTLRRIWIHWNSNMKTGDQDILQNLKPLKQ